jgi:hypothetical protein
MLTLKEQAEVYRLGLLIGYFKLSDAIVWSDYFIENTETVDVSVINVSLSCSKGINEVISQLDNVYGKHDQTIPVKTILGLLYKQLLEGEHRVHDIVEKLYTLSHYVTKAQVDEEIAYFMNVADDIFHIYGVNEVTLRLKDLISVYEANADTFIATVHKKIHEDGS